MKLRYAFGLPAAAALAIIGANAASEPKAKCFVDANGHTNVAWDGKNFQDIGFKGQISTEQGKCFFHQGGSEGAKTAKLILAR